MTETEYQGKHAGYPDGRVGNSMGHCCFGGCDLTICRICGNSRCVRDFHTCPYVGRHRAEDPVRAG